VPERSAGAVFQQGCAGVKRIAEREVNDFDEIELKGVGSLFVEQGEREYLRIEAADEVMRAIRAEVVGKRLIISHDWESALLLMGSAAPLDFHVGVTELKALAVSGSGEFLLRGQAVHQELRLSGASTYQARDLTSRDIDMDIAGAGKAVVRVSHNLDVSVSGAGKVAYIGDPNVSQTIAGAGKVTMIAS
jgi:hypothetical protein